MSCTILLARKGEQSVINDVKNYKYGFVESGKFFKVAGNFNNGGKFSIFMRAENFESIEILEQVVNDD